MTTYEKPLPRIEDDDTAVFWNYCRDQELRMQKCSECGHIRFPVSMLCPKCHSLDYEWHKMSGKGKIYSYITFRQAYHPAYKNDLPYVVGVIQLEEGPSMESNIIGCAPEDVDINMEVQVNFEKVTDRITLPKFSPIN